MFRVCQKLKTLKPILKNLNKKDFSWISTRVVHAHDHLVSTQIKLDRDPMNAILQNEERVAYAKYVDLCSVEEKLALQKARIQWLGLGDRNSRFFRTIKGNVNKGRISSVMMPNGDRVTKSADIFATFVDSFTNLFGDRVTRSAGYERISNLVSKRVSVDQFNDLARKVTDKEITDAFRSLKANKAPDPDGYFVGFFKKIMGGVGERGCGSY